MLERALSGRRSSRPWPTLNFRGNCRLASLAAVLALCGPALAWAADRTDDDSQQDDRLREAITLFSADEMEGRGPGTHGLDLAADYLAQQFRSLGLVTDVVDGSPFQKFSLTTSATIEQPTVARLTGPAALAEANRELKLGEEFTPLAFSGSGAFDLPLAFVGYGITAPDLNYDDYAGLDVEGKAVIILRHEPQQANPHSAFAGTDNSPYAPFMRKVSNAFEHGAAAILFLTDEYDIRQKLLQHAGLAEKTLAALVERQQQFQALDEPSLADVQSYQQALDQLTKELQTHADALRNDHDPLIPFDANLAASESGRIPVLHVRRAALDPVVKAALGRDLAELERAIDGGAEPVPQSAELPGCRIAGDVTVQRIESEVKNVLAVLPGTGEHAEETIVIGAHYDHLGYGGYGSLAPGAMEIHNGADDNGSGSVTLVEVARLLAEREQPLPRRIVFMAFSAEERGLIGSAYYCKHPVFPLEQTIAMLNMDMVGRLNENKLIVQGFDTAAEFGPLLEELNIEHGFEYVLKPGGFGPSDHASFYPHGIPVLHFFTGTHAEYHTPSDDAPLINIAGMRRIADLVAEMAVRVAAAESRPTYQESAQQPTAGGGGGDRPSFGSIPDFAQAGEGYAISGVAKDSPAERAGLQGGDVIIRLGESRIGNLEDFDSALRKFKPGDVVPVVVRRGEQELTFDVTLGAPK